MSTRDWAALDLSKTCPRCLRAGVPSSHAGGVECRMDALAAELYARNLAPFAYDAQAPVDLQAEGVPFEVRETRALRGVRYWGVVPLPATEPTYRTGRAHHQLWAPLWYLVVVEAFWEGLCGPGLRSAAVAAFLRDPETAAALEAVFLAERAAVAALPGGLDAAPTTAFLRRSAELVEAVLGRSR